MRGGPGEDTKQPVYFMEVTMYPTSKQLHARHEKARKKMKSERGFRGKVKKFILDCISKDEMKKL